MKKILFIITLTIFKFHAHGQVDLKNYSTSFTGDVGSKGPMIIVATLDQGLYTDRFVEEEDTLFAGFASPIPMPDVESNDTMYVSQVDSSEAHFFVTDIFRNNAKEFEFRIIENKNKEIVSWHDITQFAADSIQINDFKTGMAYLGAYKTTLGNSLLVEIRKKGSSKILQRIGVMWQQTKPRLLNIYTATDFNDFLIKLKKEWHWKNKLSKQERVKWAALYPPNEIDSNTWLPKKLILESKEDNIIFFLDADVFQKTALEYRVLRFGDVYLDWRINDFDNNFIWLKYLEHGEYKLEVRYAIQRHNVMVYRFKIKPKWYQSGRFQAILGGLSTIFLGFFILLYFFIRQKIKRKREKKEREKLESELKAIRSQLNPHFVFNALSSIQGLMNKNDLTQANYYLTEFSTLLRESLMSNDKEFVPFNTELKTLETYMKLEQLRFPFQYSINIDANLDKNAIELPYLLLQPLVENAIKHGVSNLYEKGLISIFMTQKNKDLAITIKDNGKGFNTEGVENLIEKGSGYGLKLTKNRVRLLTESNPMQSVHLFIKSDEINGTTTELIFKNWL